MTRGTKRTLFEDGEEEICIGVKRLQTCDRQCLEESRLELARGAQLAALESARVEKQMQDGERDGEKGAVGKGLPAGKRYGSNSVDPYTSINETLRRAHMDYLQRAGKGAQQPCFPPR